MQGLWCCTEATTWARSSRTVAPVFVPGDDSVACRICKRKTNAGVVVLHRSCYTGKTEQDSGACCWSLEVTHQFAGPAEDTCRGCGVAQKLLHRQGRAGLWRLLLAPKMAQ
eukprot:1158790-Pelagomonas_calceolata.AAC.13